LKDSNQNSKLGLFFSKDQNPTPIYNKKPWTHEKIKSFLQIRPLFYQIENHAHKMLFMLA
jgi:hypothetical protein